MIRPALLSVVVFLGLGMHGQDALSETVYEDTVEPYVVRSGDTISHITHRMLGDSLLSESRGEETHVRVTNARTHNLQAQQRDPGSLWHFYRAMIGLRNTHASIRRGAWLGGRSDGLVAQWQREADTPAGPERTLVLINYGTRGSSVQADTLPPGASLHALWPRWGAPARADAHGQATLHLAPQSVRVYEVRQHR